MPCLGSYSHCFDYSLNFDMTQVPQGEVLASQDSSVQAGKAERQESTDRVRGAQEFRWKQLAAFERKHHSSLERAFEVAAQTAEESQPQRDLLKEAVPLAAPKVCRPQRPAHRGLEKLSQVCREKAVLAQENAALEAQLAATERDLRGVSKQLAEARSEKESLQSSLLEAQQHVSELEIARSRVEAQVRTATQAKEATLKDVRGLRRELLAVRSLSKQQCEDMAQQLRWAEEQCSKALRLWQSAEEVKEELNIKLQAELQEAQRKMKAMGKRHKEEMERMHKVLLQYSPAEEKQMDAGSAIKAAAAAASSEEASSLQPENPSVSSSTLSSQEREKQFLKLLRRVVRVGDPEKKYTGWTPIGSGGFGTIYKAFNAATGRAGTT
ncbi:rootletin-like [Vidua chalybeata]|uniref:rootletin-like n=1 Tax=Vidua chalybeata TaxID=81927 RepID=UPI0023A8D46F|nr:rootletin-like [Vidua chalybeata]